MVDAFAITSPPYNWYLQVDNDKTVSIKKNINFLGKKKLVCVYLSCILLLDATTSANSLGYKKRVLKRLLKDSSAAHLVEKLGESATVNEFHLKIHASWKS